MNKIIFYLLIACRHPVLQVVLTLVTLKDMHHPELRIEDKKKQVDGNLYESHLIVLFHHLIRMRISFVLFMVIIILLSNTNRTITEG